MTEEQIKEMFQIWLDLTLTNRDDIGANEALWLAFKDAYSAGYRHGHRDGLDRADRCHLDL